MLYTSLTSPRRYSIYVDRACLLLYDISPKAKSTYLELFLALHSRLFLNIMFRKPRAFCREDDVYCLYFNT